MRVLDRITVNPRQCGGRPCIRGMRIRVTDVLDMLAAGLNREQVLEELPDLEIEDIDACLRFASRQIDHPPSQADQRRLGFLKGEISVPADFDEMGRNEVERLFEAGS